MDKIDTTQAKQVDLLAVAERYSELRRNAHHDHQGICPRCGQDFFHVYETKTGEWRFRCYECHDKPGDGIEMLRWLQPGLSFADAVAQLTGNTVTSARPSLGTGWPPLRPEPKRIAKPKPQRVWESQAALAKLRRAFARLFDDMRERSEGGAGREYLLRRGIEPGTWLQFRLGFEPAVGVPGTYNKALRRYEQLAPAIALPWFDQAGELHGIRYRYLEAQEGTKLVSEPGSSFAGRLFGWQALSSYIERLTTLLIVEGELNCLSCWQVANETHIDVLSLGSESQQLTPEMIEFASGYGQVIAWLDDPKRAAAAAVALPGALALNSPMIDGKKLDANDMLQSRCLGGFLSHARARPCKSAEDRERLLWDLWDVANGWQGVDGGTAQVIERLAGELGKTVRLYQPQAEVDRWITWRD